MTVNLKDKPIKDLDGEDVVIRGEALDMARAAGDLLIAAGKDDPIKAFELATKIRKGPVELDTSDFKRLYAACEAKDLPDNQRPYTSLVSAQLMLELDRQKAEADAEAAKKKSAAEPAEGGA